MKSIWKFQLDVTDRQVLCVPKGMKILSVRTQRETPCLWALVDPDAKSVPLTIYVYGTGHPVPDNPGRFIGTVFLSGRSLVFHVFEGL